MAITVNLLSTIGSILLIIYTTLVAFGCAVVQTEIRLISDSGKTDYVLEGEGFEISCHYLLQTNEKLDLVQWDVNGVVIYVFKISLSQPVASGVFKDRVDYSNKSPHTIIVRNSTKEMHGKYTCHLNTDLEANAVTNSKIINIITDSCKDDNWSSHSDMVNCKEEIRFYCINMFPKPSPSCGIYNDYTDSFIQSEPLDHIRKMEDGTFELSLFRIYYASNYSSILKEDDGRTRLSFRCQLSVLGTSWRREVRHRLFGSVGCTRNPIKLTGATINMISLRTSAINCWKTVTEGTVVTYQCSNGFEDSEIANSMICYNNTWIAFQYDESKYKDSNRLIDWDDIVEKSQKLSDPTCNANNINSVMSIIIFFINLNIFVIMNRYII